MLRGGERPPITALHIAEWTYAIARQVFRRQMTMALRVWLRVNEWSVSLSAGFLLEVAEHGGAEESVRAGLVAFALLAKPSNDVRIEAKSELLLYRPIKGIADGIAPEFLRELRDVGEVDGAVRTGSELCQAALASRRDGARREFLSHDFRHNVGAPFAWLFGQK